MRRALGDHIFDNYVKLKRKEWDDYRVQLTEWGDRSEGAARAALRLRRSAA